MVEVTLEDIEEIEILSRDELAERTSEAVADLIDVEESDVDAMVDAAIDRGWIRARANDDGDERYPAAAIDFLDAALRLELLGASLDLLDASLDEPVGVVNLVTRLRMSRDLGLELAVAPVELGH